MNGFLSSRNWRRVELSLLCLLLVGVASYLIWLVASHRAERRAESQRLLRLKHVAVGALENLPSEQSTKGDQDCIAAFETLVQAAPDEAIGYRNRVIAHLIALSRLSADDETAPRSVAEAEAAMGELARIEGDGPLLRLLRANLAKEAFRLGASANPQAILSEYTAAAAMAPDDPLIWSEWFLAAHDVAGVANTKETRAVLLRASELWPDNLAINLELAQMQAEERDRDILDTLEKLRENVRLFEATPPISPIDLQKWIDDATVAVERGDEASWIGVVRVMLRLSKAIAFEPAYLKDQARLARHPLEYMLSDFSREFYRRREFAKPVSEAIDVAFERPVQSDDFPSPENVRCAHLVDYDLDGVLEIALIVHAATGDVLEIYGREESPLRWSRRSTCNLPAGFNSILAADLDYDVVASGVHSPTSAEGQPCAAADPDFIVYGPTGLRVVSNVDLGKPRPRQLTLDPRSRALHSLTEVLAATTADLDHDGDLDLAVSTVQGMSLWRNQGHFQFRDISERSLLPPLDRQPTSIVAVDWDRNVAIDLLLSGPDWDRAGILENSMHGRFRWRPLESGFERSGGADVLAVLESDSNASWDLIAAGERGLSLTRTITPSAGAVRAIESRGIDDGSARGVIAWDYDNDGSTDILTWGAGEPIAFRGGDDGAFVRVGNLFRDPPSEIESCDVGDLDDDGDLDAIFVAQGRATLRINQGGNRNHWLKIALSAESRPEYPSRRTNIHGIGSLVEIKSGDSYQAQIVSRPSTHVGLGMQTRPDLVRVLFTNGIPQNVLRPRANLAVCEKQRVLGTSCPYLYTWNGDHFEFVTDCLWNAPLGLQLAEGVLAPSRGWEYLKIDGDRLALKDGGYELRITEELWEAVYLDQVRLLAVDRPADVEIYSNEKVGPEAIAGFKIHTTRRRQTPLAAATSCEKDVLAGLAADDGDYVKPFAKRLMQGLTEPSYLELNLGPLMQPKRITLFLTGWVFPGDTNLSVGVSQDASLPTSQPPSLWVPNADGEWTKTIEYLGFPGGKTKTIAVDLSSAFLTNDYRLRIATNMEFYWDRAFFTVDEHPAEFVVRECSLEKAELRYRGFSERVERGGNNHETYRYDRVDRAAKWPPMSGRLTRFGEVRQLLQQTDDRFVVFAAGDEVALRFTAPASPADAAWKRDFILYNAGWEKDANMNTVYGQSVEPLPFRAMSAYPYPPEETFPDTASSREYLRRYQTREWSRSFWEQLTP